MRALRVLLIGLVLAVIGILSGIVQEVREVQAIPAFARKYDFACNVCHVPGFPKLNDFGNIFRDQGYQLGTDQELPTWEGLTKGFWPVSFRVNAGYELANQRVNGGSAQTGGVWSGALDVLSYGILDRNIAYGIVLTGATATQNSGGGIDLESAFARVMNLERFLGGPSNSYLLNFKAGKFELDVPFSEKRSPTLNNSFVMYHYIAGTPWIQTTLAGLDVTAAAANAANYVNPNQFALGDNQPGIELTGITKTDVTGGYFRYSLAGLTTNLNGPCPGPGGGTTFTGGATPGASSGTALPGCTGMGGRNFDFYGHVTQSFGGYGIQQGQRLGAFVLLGEAPTVDNPTCPACQGTAGTSRRFTRVGGDVSLTYDRQWNLFGAYMYARDSTGLFANTQAGPTNANGTPGTFQDAAWHGGFAELDYNPAWLQQGQWLWIYRYDLIRNVRQGITSFANNYNNVDSHTAMIRYYIHQSMRTDFVLHAEVNFYRDKGVGLNGSNLNGESMFVGFDWAF